MILGKNVTLLSIIRRGLWTRFYPNNYFQWQCGHFLNHLLCIKKTHAIPTSHFNSISSGVKDQAEI